MKDREERIVEEAMRQVAERRQRRQGRDIVRWILLWWLVVLLAFFLAPWPLEEKVWTAAHGLCAQPEGHMLCFGVGEACGRILPLCARDSGLYLGALLGIGYLLLRGRWLAAGRPPRWLWVVFGGIGVFFVVDVVNSVADDWYQAAVYAPHNGLRLLTGLLVGAATSVLLLWAINLSFAARRTGEAVLEQWWDLVGLLLVVAAGGAALWSGWPAFYLLLTVLTMAGMVLMLWAANAMFLLMRMYGSALLERGWQATPALFWGGVASVVEMALLSWLRGVVG